MCQPNHGAGTSASQLLLVFPSSMDERDIIRLAEWYESRCGVDFDDALAVVSQGGDHPSNYSIGEQYYVVEHHPVTGWQWITQVRKADEDPDDDRTPDWDEREQGLWEKQNFC
ncbi:hypothetical protein CLV58_10620 [Spirosoma oryzae]|uniref:Uncharacterized protein n=1 Tax=Spirosoma oryzae TaxID=1469603 RepID=A0A2T0T596_9BACT|nr:hypothetical protein [Spirosoma oryzae]PRY40837.1 hypothetical protein CLV58_10620 [Spirosoma oryzae]